MAEVQKEENITMKKLHLGQGDVVSSKLPLSEGTSIRKGSQVELTHIEKNLDRLFEKGSDIN